MPQHSTPPGRRNGRKQEEGFVMVLVLSIMTILMLMLVTVLATSTSNLRQSDGYSGLSRARNVADAGQVATNYALTEQALPLINSNFSVYATAFAKSGNSSVTTPIIPSGSYGTALASLNGLSVVNPTGTLGTGTNAGTYTTSTVFTNFRADEGSFSTSGQTYYADYTSTSTGTVGPFKRVVKSAGTLKIRLGRQYLNQFLMLADDGGSQQGNFFATGMNYDGPVHINKNWRFSGSPAFLMGATTAATAVDMYKCSPSAGYASVSTQSTDCTTPNWNGSGLAYAQPPVSLPTNAFSQENAALGLDAAITTAPTTSTVCAQLGLLSTCTLTNGAYFPTGGGIYIRGDATVALSVGPSPSNAQIYTIVANGVTTVYTVDYAAKTTTMLRNGATTVYPRIPNGQLFVDGKLTSLTGPARVGSLPTPAPTATVPTLVVKPAIARETALNIAARDSVTITGDVTYQDDPRSVPDAKNVLGIIAGTGNVTIGATAPADVYLHGALLAGASGKGFSVDNYDTRAVSGSIHMLGSMAESTDPPRGIGSIAADGKVTMVNGFGDDFKFDTRFTNGGTAPPFFPATSLFAAKTSWPNQSNWQEQ